MPRTAKPHFIIAVDFGGSRTKIIYQHRSDQPQLLTMPPEAFIATEESLEQYGRTPAGQMSRMQGLTSFCWVQLLDKKGEPDETKIGAVGHLGAQIALYNTLNVAKNEKALYKLLGAVWVVQQTLIGEGYKIPDDFGVAVQCLLPPDEASFVDDFKARVESAFAEGFMTPTGMVQPQLWGFECKPEGLGVARAFASQYPQYPNATVFMLGHRNATAVLIRNREPKIFKASGLGFQTCLDMLHGAHGVSAERLMEVVFEARLKDDFYPYYRVTSYSDPDLKEKAGMQLCQEFSKANHAYYARLKNWIEDVLSDDKSKAIVFCGGGVNALGPLLEDCRPDLYQYFDPVINIPDSIEVGPEYANRLEDIYGVFESMQAELRLPKAKPVKLEYSVSQ